MPPIVVKASLDIGSAIIFIASLSFIGLGAAPPAPEWGAMIAAGRVKFFDWWLATFPGLAILSVVLAFNLLGDGLRDALDPRLRRRVTAVAVTERRSADESKGAMTMTITSRTNRINAA